jgi:hypothetical protein
MGIRVGGRDFGSYCHCDSYPEGLGKDIVADYHAAIEEFGLDGLKQRAASLEVLDQDQKPTAEQKKRLSAFSNTGVSEQTADDPYCLVRNLQGKLLDTIRTGVILDAMDFVKQSLFCEWGYIVNLDEMKLEIYKGIQQKPHGKGRYADAPPSRSATGTDFYACALINEFQLDSIPENWVEIVQKTAYPDD